MRAPDTVGPDSTDLTVGSTWTWARARSTRRRGPGAVADPQLPGRKREVRCVGGRDLEHTGSNAKRLVSELTPQPQSVIEMNPHANLWLPTATFRRRGGSSRCRRGDSKQNSTRPHRTSSLDTSGLTATKSKLGPTADVARGRPRGPSGRSAAPSASVRTPFGSQGAESATDLKHAPRAPTGRRTVRAVGIAKPIGPHTLRHAFITGLDAGCRCAMCGRRPLAPTPHDYALRPHPSLPRSRRLEQTDGGQVEDSRLVQLERDDDRASGTRINSYGDHQSILTVPRPTMVSRWDAL
jgi:hypothetical protein